MAQKQNKPTGTSPPSEMDGRFQLLLTLIALLKGARHKAKKSELEFMMVNQTFNLVPYRHAVYWEWDGENVTATAMSGLVQVDPGGPYTLWLKRVIGHILNKKFPNKGSAGDAGAGNKDSFIVHFPVVPADCENRDQEEWTQWISAQALMLAMRDMHGNVMGGLWLDREEPFTDLEMAVLDDLADGYAHVLHHFDDTKIAGRRISGWKSLFSLSRSNAVRVLAVLVVVMFLPVRMSATAPAEIIAKKPDIISVPFDGVIEKVEVVPGQAVKAGDLLARMDSTILSNKTEIAASESQTAEIALQKTERESLADRSKLAEIAILKAQLDQRTTEQKFAGDMLERSEIRAARDGIVIFSDPNALQGQPVHTGEQIMLLADPQDSELLIRVPVDSMIEINESIPARFFLNVTPLGSRRATYESIGYQATPDPDSLMTYKIRARFTGNGTAPRIGSTGTGKVYGDRTILVFNILRRPIITLRRKLGL